MERLQDKICLVTGASRGIGQKTAEVFAAEGAVVYAHARTMGCLDGWCSAQRQENGWDISPIYFDIADSAQIKEAVKKLRKEAGRVDVLVNNAGMVTNELIGMIDIGKMKAMFDVNVFGLTELTQYVVTKFMMRQGSGSIINISSVVGAEGSRGQAAYSASKGAVIALTKSMAKELAPHQVRVNSVAPGMTDTGRIQAAIKELYKEKIPEIGMGRLASTEDIANACLYFASDESSYVTGQILIVGGGLTL